MIAGVVSTYAEGSLLINAIHSLRPAVDAIAVFDGPVQGAGPVPPYNSAAALSPLSLLAIHAPPPHAYKDDADKRNAGLRWAKSEGVDWLVWLDGDEVLLWGEYLPDWIARAEYTTGVGGFPLRIVEMDGAVAYANSRIVRVSAVRKYLVGAATLELHTGMVVQLPNEKLCGAGGIPWGNMPTFANGNQATPGSDEMEMFLARHRPPVQGEPHVLHRSMLRDPDRAVQRQHEAEAERFEGLR